MQFRIFKYVIFFLLAPVMAQTDSLSTGTRGRYLSFEPSFVSKTREFKDPFDFKSTLWAANAGMNFRRSHVLRPYAEFGLAYGREKITVGLTDSALALLAPSMVHSMWLLSSFGAEVNLYETWYFRLVFKFPVRLIYTAKNPELMRQYGLLQDDQLKIQHYDFRYGLEVGRALIREELDLFASLTFGNRMLFNKVTHDRSRAFVSSAGLRYHFGSF